MDEESLQRIKNSNKVQLSLAAVMFFSPFVQNILSDDVLGFSDQERKFIRWYIRLGYVNLFLLIVSVIFGTMSYFQDYLIVTWVYKIAMFILLGLLIIGILWVIVDINILWRDKKVFQYKEVETDRANILFGFLPIYNIYIRYKLHTFDAPYRWAKESILRRLLFALVAMVTKNPTISSLILVLIIIRVASLMTGIDVLPDETKKKINKIFYKNPEEVRWYVSWTVVFFVKKFILHAKVDNKTELDLDDCIQEQKNWYKALYTPKDENKLYREYLILLWALSYFIYNSLSYITQWISIAPVALILLRYIVMYAKWKHLPHVPLIKEFVDTCYLLLWHGQNYVKKIK